MNQWTNVATLIARPDAADLNEQEINSVVDTLQAQGAFVEEVAELASGVAADIFFSKFRLEEAREVLTHLLEPVPFDFAVQKVEGRRKQLLVSDMDSTIIEQECIDELADFAGLKEHVSEITERAMNGELDFKAALRERVALLKGLSTDVLQEAFDHHITIMQGAKQLVHTMAAHDARCVLVSGGFTFFTSRVADEVGFHINEANILDVENDKLSGTVKEPILDKTAKLNALKFHADEIGIGLGLSCVVGDGANDLDMICASSRAGGLGVAYRAKPTVQAAAREHQGAIVRHGDLTSLLYMQGYTKEDIIDT